MAVTLPDLDLVRKVIDWMRVLPGGRYNVAPPVLNDGEYVCNQISGQGGVKVAPEPSSAQLDSVATRPVTPAAVAGSNIGVTSRGKFLIVAAFAGSVAIRIRADNVNAAIRYLQVHNTPAEPSGGAAPVLAARVMAAGSATNPTFAEIVFPVGRQFSAGLTVVASTTLDTYTAVGANDHWFEVEFYPSGSAVG